MTEEAALHSAAVIAGKVEYVDGRVDISMIAVINNNFNKECPAVDIFKVVRIVVPQCGPGLVASAYRPTVGWVHYCLATAWAQGRLQVAPLFHLLLLLMQGRLGGVVQY